MNSTFFVFVFRNVNCYIRKFQMHIGRSTEHQVTSDEVFRFLVRSEGSPRLVKHNASHSTRRIQREIKLNHITNAAEF